MTTPDSDFATQDVPTASNDAYLTRTAPVVTEARGGVVLGNFKLLEKRGAGGFATVYRAWDQLLGRVVAVKMLDGGADHGSSVYDDCLQRFERERRVHALLDEHPNIVRVHQAGEHETVPVLIMEYVDGPNLAEWAQVRRPDERAIGSVGLQVAAALAHVHRKGIVHRDVKPQNILVDGSHERVKLGDFGIAQVPAESQRAYQGASAHPGTAEYMSPEQEQGLGYLDARSDIYSLGCALYQFATGSVYKIERRNMRDLRPDLSPDLARAIERCLERDPAARWSTAEEFGSGLARALSAGRSRPKAIARRLIGVIALAARSVRLPRRSFWLPKRAVALSRSLIFRALLVGALVMVLGSVVVANAFVRVPPDTAVASASPVAPVTTLNPAVRPPTSAPSVTPVPPTTTPQPTPEPTPSATEIPQAAPVTQAPARVIPPPVPPAPTLAPAAGLKLIPPSGRVGTTFVVQLSNFTPGQVTMTVTNAAGRPRATLETINGDGTGLVVITPQVANTAGLYTLRFEGGGVIVSTILTVLP